MSTKFELAINLKLAKEMSRGDYVNDRLTVRNKKTFLPTDASSGWR